MSNKNLDKVTDKLMAAISALTFSENDTHEDYVRRVRPLLRAALSNSFNKGQSLGARNAARTAEQET